MRPAPGIHSADYDDLLETERGNKLAEQRRLLYVAATRAKELLVLPLHWQKDTRLDDRMLGFLVQSGIFAPPHDVPFGQARDGVFYWDTTAATVDRGSTRAPAVEASDRRATAKQMRGERDSWIARRADIRRRAWAGLRVVRPSAIETSPRGTAIPPEQQDVEAGRTLGSLFHRVMECIPLREAVAGDVEPEPLARGLAAMEAAAMGLSSDAAEQAARLAAAVVEIEVFASLVRQAVSVEREVPFAVPLARLPFAGAEEDDLLEGNMDLVLRLPGRTVIVDYKTDRPAGESAEEAAARHWPQLVLYGAAVRACGHAPSPPELAVLLVRRGILCRRVLDEALLEEAAPGVGVLLSAAREGAQNHRERPEGQ